MRKTIAPGIRQDAYGFEAEVSVGSGKNKLRANPKRFPPVDAQHDLAQRLAEMQVWQARERLKLVDEQKRTGGKIVRGTLSAAKPVYLEKAELTPDTKADRDRQLDWWIQTFPDRQVVSLETQEIFQALKGLRTNTKPSRAAAASTKNHYRFALEHLFTIVYGTAAANPVRDVPTFDEPEALPRDQSYELIDLILKNIPDMGSGPTAGQKSKAKIILRVLAYAPVTPAQLWRMSRAEAKIDWTPGDVTTPGRKKGRRKGRRRATDTGAAAAVTPSKRKQWSADAIAALRDFDAAGLWQYKTPKGKLGYSRQSLLKTLRRGLAKAIAQCEALGRHDLIETAHDMNVYSFRHSFATFVTRQTNGDLRAAAEYLDHQSQKTTSRYAKAAINEHARRVAVTIAAAMAERPAPPEAPAADSQAEGLPSTTTVHSKKAVKNAEQKRNVLKHGRTVERARRQTKIA